MQRSMGELPTDFPKQLETHFKTVFHQQNILPNKNSEAWKQISAYCNAAGIDSKERSTRMEMMLRHVFTVPAGQPWKRHASYDNFYHRTRGRQNKNRINSTESIPDNGVSCEPDAAAATVAAATVAAATATCTELEVSAERDNITQLKEMGESNDESAEDRRIRYQNLYFEYFDGDAHEMIETREKGLYPPCGDKRESQYRARPGSLLKPSLEIGRAHV